MIDFDEKSFINNLNTNIKVKCNHITTNWKLKPSSVNQNNTYCFANNNATVFNYDSQFHGHAFHMFENNRYKWIIIQTSNDVNNESNAFKNGTLSIFCALKDFVNVTSICNVLRVYWYRLTITIRFCGSYI